MFNPKCSVSIKSKMNEKQKALLINYMERNPSFGRGSATNAVNKKHWALLTAKLNRVGGACKTTKQWQKSWSDLKMEAKKKSLALSRKLKKAENGLLPPDNPNEDTRDRILSLLGYATRGISDFKELDMILPTTADELTTETELDPFQHPTFYMEDSEAESEPELDTAKSDPVHPENDRTAASDTETTEKVDQTKQWIVSMADSLKDIAAAEKEKAAAMKDISSALNKVADTFEKFLQQSHGVSKKEL